MYDRKLPTFVCDVLVGGVPINSVLKLEVFEGEFYVSLMSHKVNKLYSFRLIEDLVHSREHKRSLTKLDDSVSISSQFLGDLYIFFSEIIKKSK